MPAEEFKGHVATDGFFFGGSMWLFSGAIGSWMAMKDVTKCEW